MSYQKWQKKREENWIFTKWDRVFRRGDKDYYKINFYNSVDIYIEYGYTICIKK